MSSRRSSGIVVSSTLTSVGSGTSSNRVFAGSQLKANGGESKDSLLRGAVPDPPHRGRQQPEREAPKDRRFDSLQEPEPARRLVDGEVEDVMRPHASDVA